MLWYKAWLETRARFLISFAGITLLTSNAAYRQAKDALPISGMSYYYFVLHNCHQLLALLWIIAMTLLMMGGVVREKSVGASSFTLALPVSRGKIMRTRIFMGLAQALVLGVVPWSLMYLVACLAGKPLALEYAAAHVLMLFGGGLVFVATAMLSSSLLEGEYTAPLVAFGTIAVVVAALSEPPLRTYSPWYIMLANDLIVRGSVRLAPIPWTLVGAAFALTAALLFASVLVVERREF